MKDRDRDAADDWMREHMPDPDQLSLEDNEERGCEERFYFLRGPWSCEVTCGRLLTEAHDRATII
jgi:hypothetical protein